MPRRSSATAAHCTTLEIGSFGGTTRCSWGICAYLAFVLFGKDPFPLLSVAVALAVAVAFFVVSGMRGLRRTLSKAANAEAAARKIVEYPAAEDD